MRNQPQLEEIIELDLVTTLRNQIAVLNNLNEGLQTALSASEAKTKALVDFIRMSSLVPPTISNGILRYNEGVQFFLSFSAQKFKKFREFLQIEFAEVFPDSVPKEAWSGNEEKKNFIKCIRKAKANLPINMNFAENEASIKAFYMELLKRTLKEKFKRSDLHVRGNRMIFYPECSLQHALTSKTIIPDILVGWQDLACFDTNEYFKFPPIIFELKKEMDTDSVFQALGYMLHHLYSKKKQYSGKNLTALVLTLNQVDIFYIKNFNCEELPKKDQVFRFQLNWMFHNITLFLHQLDIGMPVNLMPNDRIFRSHVTIANGQHVYEFFVFFQFLSAILLKHNPVWDNIL